MLGTVFISYLQFQKNPVHQMHDTKFEEDESKDLETSCKAHERPYETDPKQCEVIHFWYPFWPQKRGIVWEGGTEEKERRIETWNTGHKPAIVTL